MPTNKDRKYQQKTLGMQKPSTGDIQDGYNYHLTTDIGNRISIPVDASFFF